MKTYVIIYELKHLVRDINEQMVLETHILSECIETESPSDALERFVDLCNEGIAEWYWERVRVLQILIYDANGPAAPALSNEGTILSDMTPFATILSEINNRPE